MDYKEKLSRNIRLSYFINFLVHLEFFIPIWVAFYLKYITFTELALLHALSFGLTIFLELPTGALADLIGRKKTIMLGYLFIGIGLVIVAFSTTFPMFLVSFLLRGLGDTLVSGADTALAYDTFKELEREDEFPAYAARNGFIIRIALAIGSFLGGYIYLFQNSLPYLLGGVTYTVAAFLAYTLCEPKIDSEKFSLKNYLKQTKEGSKELLKNLHTKYLTVYYMLLGGITWACLIYLNQPFAKDIGFTEVEMSWLFGGGYLTSSLLLLILSRYNHIVTRERVYIGLPIIASLGLLPGIFSTKVLAFFLIVLIQFAGGSRFSYLDKYANDEFQSKYRATAVSCLNMLLSLFVVLLVGMSGRIQDAYNTQVIFSSLGIISLLVVLPLGIFLAKHTSVSNLKET